MSKFDVGDRVNFYSRDFHNDPVNFQNGVVTKIVGDEAPYDYRFKADGFIHDFFVLERELSDPKEFERLNQNGQSSPDKRTLYRFLGETQE